MRPNLLHFLHLEPQKRNKTGRFAHHGEKPRKIRPFVHRKNKRLAPVAQAFKDFLLTDGATLIDRFVPYRF